MRSRNRALGAALLSAAWALSCSSDESPDPRPNVILIVIDNLRADHVGAYGYGRPTSPTIDGLAARGVVFRNAFAPSSWTMPSVAALFTSRHPSEHGAVSFQRTMNPALPTIAEILRDAGYKTVGATANPLNVGQRTKMARGFERWRGRMVPLEEGETGEATWVEATPAGRELRLRSPGAAEINAQVRELLIESAEGPLFLYVHYMEPHAGYDPPEPFRSRFIRDPEFDESEGFGTTDHVSALAGGRERLSFRGETRLIDLYDAEIAAADAAVSELLSWLETQGILQNAIVAIVSDHGEAFGEHDSWFHGVSLFSELTAVPFIVSDLRRRPVLPSGVEELRAVDLLDLTPTLLALVGTPPAPEMRGRDLFSSSAPDARELVSELHPDPLFAIHVRRREPRLAIIDRPRKIILDRDGRVRQFDLEADPGELGGAEGTPTPELEARAKALAAELDGDPGPGRRNHVAPIDERSVQGLRALGYVE